MRWISKGTKRKIKYKVLYHFVMLIIGFSNILPRKVWLSICSEMGKLLYLVAPKLKAQVENHLSIAFVNEKSSAEIKALARKVFIMLAKNTGLIIRDFTSSTAGFSKQALIRGVEHAEKAYQSGRGVIFLTAHLGPFESIAHDLSLRGYKPYIVGTPLKDPTLNKLLVQSRTKFGAVVIERGKDTYRIMKNMASGGTMAILIDQDTRVKSVFVDFFGRPCATPVGATLIALKTGAAVVPVFAHLNEDGVQEINYYPEVEITKTGDESTDVLVNTQTLTTIIEKEIRKFPEQWVWMHKRWKTSPLTANS